MKMTNHSKLAHCVATLLTSASLLFSPAVLQADDTEIYTDLETCDATPPQKYRFIFIVDNSGSMSTSEFTASKATIDAAAASLLNGELNDPTDPDDMKIAVVQYGSVAWDGWTQRDAEDIDHLYDISVPFTSSVATAQNWTRHFGYHSGAAVTDSGEDHQPASLAQMRLDNVYAGGGSLDVSDATNVQFVFFTDAWRDDWNTGCCSVLVNDSDQWHGDVDILPDFGEYDVLKNGSILPNGLQAQFTILHVPPNDAAGSAAAAIASPGGDYVGDVEYNNNDPEGPGTTPRRYVQGTFDASDDTDKIVELLEQVQEEIRDFTFTQVAPAISVNAFNQLRHRNEIYYSIFEPSSSPRWGGNVKRFEITGGGDLIDVNGNAAIDSSTGAIAADAKSFWTDGAADGPNVDQGGFRGELATARTIYTEPEAFETSPGSDLTQFNLFSTIKYESLGMTDCPVDTSGGGSGVSDATYSGLEFVARKVWETVDSGIPSGGIPVAATGTLEVEYLSRSKNQVRFVITNDDGDEMIASGSVFGGSLTNKRTLTVDIAAMIAANPSFDDSGTVFTAELEVYAYSKQSWKRYFDYDISYSTTSVAVAEDDCAERRKNLLGWVEGRDMFNEFTEDDVGDVELTPHQFAADPLHSRPFVITYQGSSVGNSKDVLFEADNLGILRAIDASDGGEIWSFIPEKHLDNVQRYAYDQANLAKDYGLDGQISVIQREASGSSATSFSLSEVTLYVGERRGGSSYYSLDVTDAHIGAKPKLDWTITGGSGDFSDLAQTWSAMQPAKLFTSCSNNYENCTEKEVLVFGGGYDPAYDADGSSLPSGSSGNAIFIVDVATGDLVWSAGNNGDAAGGRTHDLNLGIDHSIPSTPTVVDINGDGGIDMIFAVDISGAVWRIDFDVTKTSGSGDFATGGQIADLSSDGLRHFYAPLDVSLSDPTTGTSRFNIVVGSGYRAQPNDSDDAHNRIYVIHDPYTTKRYISDASKRYKYVDNSTDIIKPGDLLQVGATPSDTTIYHGLYLPLVDSDEKVLEKSLTLNNTVIVTSFVPGSSADGTCGVGSGRVYVIDINTGTSAFSNDYVDLDAPGIPPPPEIVHLDEGLALCIGTQCVMEDKGMGTPGPDADPDEDPCDSGNFGGGTLQAAFSASTCGLDRGRGYRSYWRTNN